MAEPVKIVDGPVATDEAGNTVEAEPVRIVSGTAVDSAGKPTAVEELVESDTGKPVYIVDDTMAQDSVGNWKEARPVTGITDEAIDLSAFAVDDDAAAGATIAAISVPEGYTPELIYDANGAFAISGGNLVVGTALLTPGTLRPLIRAKKSGAADLTLRPEITVNSAFVPSDISGLVGAWVCDAGVTVDGNGKATAWAGQFGTSSNWSAIGVSPDYSAVGPKGKSVLNFSAGSSHGLQLATPIAVDDCTIVLCWRPKTTDSTTRYILGVETSGFILGHHSNVLDMNFGTTASVIPATNYNLVTTRYRCDIITHDGTSGTGPTAVQTDGGAAGSSVNAGVNSRNLKYLGRQAGGNYASVEIAALLIYSRVLTAGEIAQLEAWAQQYRTSEWYFANAGADASAGYNSATPKQNPASYINGASTTPPFFRPGDRIFLKRGDFFYDQSITATSPLLTSQARPIRIQAYGAGDQKPRIWGQAPSALAWSASGSNWTATLARTNAPTVLWWYRDGIDERPVHIYNRTVNQDRSFSYSAGTSTLTVRLESGRDPNTEIIVIPKDSTSQSLWGATRNDIHFRDLEIRHYAGQMLAPQGARNAIRECDIGHTADDGWSPGGTGSICQMNEIVDCGGNRGTSSGPGDGVSCHGGSGHLIQYNDIRDCGVAGIRNEMGTGAKIEGNSISNCNQPIRALANASYDFAVTWEIDGNEIIRTADDQEDAGIIIDSGCTANQTFNVTNNRLTGLGTVRGKAIDKRSGSVVFSQSGNSQTGFSSLT